MKKQIHLFITALFLLFMAHTAFSQIVISDNPAAVADPAAMLDLQSTSKGFLFTRMIESERDAISNPPTGMIIYQTDNITGLYYNTGTAGSPVWEKITDETHIGGYWTPTGSDLYYTDGNVGVGTTTPSHPFHVEGISMFDGDSVYITGSPGQIFLNAETGYDPGIRFGYEGSAMFRLFISGASTTNPYFQIGADPYDIIWGMRPTGRVWHDYKGTTDAAYVLRSTAAHPSLSILNSNSTITNFAHGIQVSLPNVPTTLLTTVPAGIAVFIQGDGTGIFAINENHDNKGWMGTEYNGVSGEHGSSGNRGALGTPNTGAYGVYDDNGNQGNLGLLSFGVQGTHGSSDYWAALGTATAGVYARLTPNGSSQVLADGDFGIKGVGVEIGSDNNRGSNYALGNQVGGVEGYNTAGTRYSAGVAGYTDDDDADGRTSGVFGGIEDASEWGALGYENSGNNNYGAYFTSQAPSAKVASDPSSSIGIGVYGDLFGAHIHGEVYGLYTQGENYGLFTEGDVYRTGADVHLQQDNSGQSNVMYTLVSTEMTVQTYGIGQLQSGKSSVYFDDAFANVVSANEPIIVTVTPIGKSEWVYLEKVDENGFTVLENNDGKSNVQFSWIAIGKRKGFENMSLPAEVIASDYSQKIQSGLHNDNDITTDGEGLYYQNGVLVKGQAPQTISGSNTESAVEVKFDRGSIVDREKTVAPTKDYTATEDVPVKKK